MKFTDGAWLIRDGFKINRAREVRFEKIEDSKVTLTVPTFNILNRGMTLGGVYITLEITSPMEDVFKIKAYHHKGSKDLEPSYFVIDPKDVKLKADSNDTRVKIKSGEAELFIDKKDYKMTLMLGKKTVAVSSGLAYIEGGDKNYMREQLDLRVGEHVYGLGERFGALVKNGQSIDIENKDGGTFTEQAYKNIPFYVTDKDLGVFVDHSETVSFEVGSENVSKVQFSVEGEALTYYMFAGRDMKDVLLKYTKLTGRAPAVPEWSYGLWLSTSFTTDYDEKTVLSFVDGMKERGIDLKVFHFDCFWMKDSHWCNFKWDEKMFPDPKGLLTKLHERGLKVCVWINPYIAQESELFDEGVEKGYFLKRKDGSVWQWDLWQAGMAIVDFTNKDARKWYQEKLKVLLDMGVDCFKTDFGERIPTEDVIWADGKDSKRMHNFYTYLYNETVFELLKEVKGEGEAIVFSRSATAGCQKFPVHWGGDCKSDYVSMEQTIRGGLSLMMSGFSYWSHDIGGFEDKSTADVYKRWAAFGLMSSHSRLHGSSSYRVPWNYDDEASEVVKFYTELKSQLVPYLTEEAKTGLPLMRPMALEFQNDPACAYLDHQYMLGSKILIAPVFDEEGKVTYYLPKGKWRDIYTGDVKELTEGKFYTETRGYMEMPIYEKR